LASGLRLGYLVLPPPPPLNGAEVRPRPSAVTTLVCDVHTHVCASGEVILLALDVPAPRLSCICRAVVTWALQVKPSAGGRHV
jgi:hypothetical protein